MHKDSIFFFGKKSYFRLKPDIFSVSLLILREKKYGDFFWAIEVPKKITNFQKILKNFYTGELHIKRYNFAPGAANHTFFGLTLYIIF